MSNSYYYALYGDLLLRDRVRSVVDSMKTMKPTLMEIWLFKEAPNIFFNNKLAESEVSSMKMARSDQLKMP